MSRNVATVSGNTPAASTAPSASGLEVLGIPGRDYLREALTSCSDPLQAIEEFQVENGILLPSLRPMMPLLDLHGVKRHDFHISVMEVTIVFELTRIGPVVNNIFTSFTGSSRETAGASCRGRSKRRERKRQKAQRIVE